MRIALYMDSILYNMLWPAKLHLQFTFLLVHSEQTEANPGIQ